MILTTINILSPYSSKSMGDVLEFYAGNAYAGETGSQGVGTEVEFARRASKFFNSLAGGTERAIVTVAKSDQVMGSGTLTFSGAVAGSTFTVAGVTLTGGTTTTSATFNVISGNDNATAFEAAKGFNMGQAANSASSCVAAVSGNVVTIYSLKAEPADSSITLEASGTGITAGAASLSSGALGTSVDMNYSFVGVPVSYPSPSRS